MRSSVLHSSSRNCARTAARYRPLPHRVTISEIRGDLHVHSDWTDGTAPIAVMAAAAEARGYEYIALTDHSRRVAMAHGSRSGTIVPSDPRNRSVER